MASEESKAPASSSLEDRIEMPSKDEQEKPVEKAVEKDAGVTSEEKPAPEKTDEAPTDQLDGATDRQNGSGLNEPEFDVEVKLSDMQADPNNPLFSAKSFEQLGLPEGVLKGIYAMNFRKPSKIQERALPLLLNNPPTNMIGQSQSGTGKTAAFVLNMLARCDINVKATQAIVLAPSRELARQILGVVQVMGQFIPGLVVGQAVPDELNRGKKVEGHIVIGTPGTTMQLLRRNLLESSQVKVLVLDEADSMLAQQNLGSQCEQTKARLPKTIQVVLFSATFPDHVVRFAARFAPNANEITLKHEELTVEGIKQLYMDCEGEEAKYDALVKLYGLMTIGSSIIFVRTRESAARIQQRMTAEGHQVVSLTGAQEGKDRDDTIDAFRSGTAKVLITTNVLARGIDVQSVSMVINYDVPTTQDGVPDPETYLHRIGRTGRFGRVGVAITFIYDEKSWEQLNKIATFFDVAPTRLATTDWDEVEETVRKVIKSSRAGTNLKMEE